MPFCSSTIFACWMFDWFASKKKTYRDIFADVKASRTRSEAYPFTVCSQNKPILWLEKYFINYSSGNERNSRVLCCCPLLDSLSGPHIYRYAKTIFYFIVSCHNITIHIVCRNEMIELLKLIDCRNGSFISSMSLFCLSHFFRLLIDAFSLNFFVCAWIVVAVNCSIHGLLPDSNVSTNYPSATRHWFATILNCWCCWWAKSRSTRLKSPAVSFSSLATINISVRINDFVMGHHLAFLLNFSYMRHSHSWSVSFCLTVMLISYSHMCVCVSF